MPVTNVGSRWSSGDLIFYEKNVSLAVAGNILEIADDEVVVGSTTNDIDFSWLGYTTGTFDLDAAAHTLAMTGMATSTDGLVTSTSTTGFRSNPTFVGDLARTNYGLAIGTRANALTVTIGSGSDQNLDPIQLKLLVAGVNPGNSSTLNASYMLITHSTAMTNMRLKCSDWNIVVSANVSDVYVYQGELDFTATSTISAGHEACAMGLQVNASAGIITGDVCGARIVMAGASLPATTSIGLDISSRTSATLTHGLYFYIQSAATMTNAIYIENAGTLTNPIKFSAVITNAVSVTSESPLVDISATANAGYIRCLVGSTVRYIPLYAAKTS